MGVSNNLRQISKVCQNQQLGKWVQEKKKPGSTSLVGHRKLTCMLKKTHFMIAEQANNALQNVSVNASLLMITT